MFKSATVLLAACSLLIVSIQPCMARGGGGFHGGGGGFHGGGFGGGYRGGNFGGYRGGDFGGYRGGFDGGRSFRAPDNFGALRDGNHDRGAVSGNHSFRQHNPLPSDFGFGHGGARSYLATGHATHPWTNNMMRDRGNTVRNNFWNHNYFNHNWWHDHPGAWFAAGWGVGTAWAWTAWPALGTWYGWGDNVAPVFYDYGTNVVYDNDEVYYGGQPFASADDFYQQASTIASTNLSTDPNQGEWKPLGVFGLVQGEQNSATAMFQLATNKEGTIAGNFCDMLSGNTMPVQGSVDKQTQRAAWTVGDNFDTVYEAGIYNLTQEEAPVLVHFGKDRTQQWMLVRLKQPSQAQLQAAPLSK